MNDPKNLPTYTNEEVAHILTRGLDRHHEGGRISHDELFETAREIGMSTLEIEAAVAEEVRRRAEMMAREEQRALAVRKLVIHAATWALLSVALAVVDRLMTGGVWWYFVVIAWGGGVAAHAFITLRRAPEPEPAPALPPAAVPPRIELRGLPPDSPPQPVERR